MRTRPIRIAGVLAVLVLLGACGGGGGGSSSGDTGPSPFGSAVGTAVSATIGPAGGALASGDGKATLSIPAGALVADTTISIQPVTNTAPGGQGLSYRFAPSVVVFSVPAQITFPFTGADIAGSTPEALSIGFQDDQGVWRAPKGAVRDDVAKTISVSTTHFSIWSRLIGWQIVPGEKSVPAGGQVALKVLYCEPVTEGELSTLLSQCATDDEISPLVSGWAVDGHPGGTLGAGIVSPASGGRANYTAPPVVIGQQIHAVSVELIRRNAGKVVLVSNITVVGEGTYTVTGTYRENPSFFPCSLGSSDMGDRVSFLVGQGAASSITGIDNGTTTFTAPQPSGAGSRIEMDANPEYFTVTGGNAFKPSGQPNIVQVGLDGTTKTGGCSVFVGQDRAGQIPSLASTRGADFSFDITKFVNGSQTVVGAPGGTDLGWTWVITQN